MVVKVKMFPSPQLDARSDIPLYRQLYAYIKELIGSGRIAAGERLPPTRELAGLLGLNRTTVSAAYELLESDGLIRGHVGRGSFVCGQARVPAGAVNWEELLPGADALQFCPVPQNAISFAASRPSAGLFPLEEFRAACREVIAGDQIASILQLGSPAGYAPLRHYLLEQARAAGIARQSDDVVITNGCQQALDLIQRLLVRPGDVVAIEDPVYPGLKNVFARAGARLASLPFGPDGLDLAEAERAFANQRPKLLIVTSNFQNPTGETLSAAARRAILKMAKQAGTLVVENDIYGELRYEGESLAALKQLDESGDTILLRSFSKITFPGLRVGWVIGPKPFMARLAEAKQASDLHTDQLSQAVLLRFAESGRLNEHRTRVLTAGAERLRAVLAACEKCLPQGTRFTRPSGGMNVWVRLPEPLDSADLLARAHGEGVAYLPGRFFEVSRHDPGALRLSFAGLAPEEIRAGLAILGNIFHNELERARDYERFESATAMV